MYFMQDQADYPVYSHCGLLLLSILYAAAGEISMLLHVYMQPIAKLNRSTYLLEGTAAAALAWLSAALYITCRCHVL